MQRQKKRLMAPNDKAQKILVIRFSSIGDIVLTSPVVRCLKEQLPNASVHYLTKKANNQILEHNPYIDKIHILNDSLIATIEELRKENFDYVVDLHKNLRSGMVKLLLCKPSRSFPKLNLRKWFYVKTKNKNLMPNVHIVDRYFEATKRLNIVNDNRGLDFFISEGNSSNTVISNNYVVIVCGAKHATKQIPPQKIEYLIKNIKGCIVLLGDKSDAKRLDKWEFDKYSNVLNLCGKCSLSQSALYVKEASLIITPDTGLMHIAAAYKKNIIVVWGNTTPELGMYPYIPKGEGSFINMEVKGLSCRPCSKLGYEECPKRNFACMESIDWDAIVYETNKYISGNVN